QIDRIVVGADRRAESGRQNVGIPKNAVELRAGGVSSAPVYGIDRDEFQFQLARNFGNGRAGGALVFDFIVQVEDFPARLLGNGLLAQIVLDGLKRLLDRGLDFFYAKNDRAEASCNGRAGLICLERKGGVRDRRIENIALRDKPERNILRRKLHLLRKRIEGEAGSEAA